MYIIYGFSFLQKDGEVKTGYRYTSNEGKEYQIEISTKSVLILRRKI